MRILLAWLSFQYSYNKFAVAGAFTLDSRDKNLPQILEVSPCTVARIAKSFFQKPAMIEFPSLWMDTSTGRAAMLPILTYLRKTGTLQDKNAPFLVPPWLCQSFLHTMRKHCAPTLSKADNPKAALIFHQFGFPQEMNEVLDYCDRYKITVVEDCANLFEGYYQGRRLGTFGLGSIFSFWKTFPSLWGGGMATKSEDLFHHARQSRLVTHDWLANIFIHLTKYATDARKTPIPRSIHALLEMSYATAERCQIPFGFSNKIVTNEIKGGALSRRRSNYLFFRKELSEFSFFERLPEEGVFPYLVPLIAPADKLEKIAGNLRVAGVKVGLMRFDVNRNIFNPDYQVCLPLSVHQDLTESDLFKITAAIRHSI